MGALDESLRAIVAGAVAGEVAPLREEVRALREQIAGQSERPITLREYRGDSGPRAAAAFERRHPELTAISIGIVGKSRKYRRCDLDSFFRDGAK